mgnify:CR=1 FL=1
MGTRGFVGFVIGGVEKIGYVHSDAYPGGVGLDMLEWLRGVGDLAVLAEEADALAVVHDGRKPTPEEIERLKPWTNLGVGEQSEESWYCLLRATQGEPGEILRAGFIEDADDFPTNSLHAEWGYIVDLDASTFEVYKGFQKAPPTAGRFADRPGRENGYYPAALVGSWPLTELPGHDDFVNALEPSDG